MNVSHHRSVDAKAEALPAQSTRYFKLYDDWYFMTREGVAIGPNVDMAEARLAVINFITFITVADNQSVQAFFESYSLKQATNVAVRPLASATFHRLQQSANC